MFQQPCRWLLGELQDHFTLFDRGQCHQLMYLWERLHNQQKLGKMIKSLTLASHASQPHSPSSRYPCMEPGALPATSQKRFFQQPEESLSHLCLAFTSARLKRTWGFPSWRKANVTQMLHSSALLKCSPYRRTGLTHPTYSKIHIWSYHAPKSWIFSFCCILH